MAAIIRAIQEQFNVVKSVGGYKNAFRRLLREANVRTGTLIGTDKHGNRYYENNNYMFTRNRFVEFPYVDRLSFDATQIPPEWHRWMQYMTDDPPSKVPPVESKFDLPHEINWSGSAKEYVPYSTTRPKLESWVPPKK
eukprot:Seg3634.1 transcript_id=Seg3634.1/GoldUCD/mRNA.D3Y31 product="putative NADH dehydrogenase" protein_id=Seg3634.1/GoldUCD/D3Y31